MQRAADAIARPRADLVPFADGRGRIDEAAVASLIAIRDIGSRIAREENLPPDQAHIVEQIVLSHALRRAGARAAPPAGGDASLRAVLDAIRSDALAAAEANFGRAVRDAVETEIGRLPELTRSARPPADPPKRAPAF